MNQIFTQIKLQSILSASLTYTFYLFTSRLADIRQIGISVFWNILEGSCLVPCRYLCGLWPHHRSPQCGCAASGTSRKPCAVPILLLRQSGDLTGLIRMWQTKRFVRSRFMISKIFYCGPLFQMDLWNKSNRLGKYPIWCVRFQSFSAQTEVGRSWTWFEQDLDQTRSTQ